MVWPSTRPDHFDDTALQHAWCLRYGLGYAVVSSLLAPAPPVWNPSVVYSTSSIVYFYQ